MSFDEFLHTRHDVACVVEHRLVGVEREVGKEHQPAIPDVAAEAFSGLAFNQVIKLFRSFAGRTFLPRIR